MRFLGRFLVGCLLLAFFASCSGGEDSRPVKKASSAQGPGFTLDSVQGGKLSLSDLKGKVVVLDFWATWCPPCRNSIPHLVELQTAYAAKGVTVVGISLDQNPDDLISFLKQRPVNYPVLYGTDEVKQAYRITSIPRMFVLDREGVVVGDYLGFSPANVSAMDEAIRQAL